MHREQHFCCIKDFLNIVEILGYHKPHSSKKNCACYIPAHDVSAKNYEIERIPESKSGSSAKVIQCAKHQLKGPPLQSVNS